MSNLDWIIEWLFISDEILWNWESWDKPDGVYYRCLTDERIFTVFMPNDKKLNVKFI